MAPVHSGMSMVEAFLALSLERAPVMPHRRVRLRADDGVELLAGIFEPTAQPVKIALIFFHGAGGHMAAGYLDLGASIHAAHGHSVIIPDLRGHGRSQGERGVAATPDTVWRDVDLWVDWVSRRYPSATLHLGGHSLGAGLCLNWVTRHAPAHERLPRSLVLLAPYTGRPEIDIVGGPNVSPFVQVQDGPERARGEPAVRFAYSPEIARSAGLVASYSEGMFASLAPDDWYGQLASAPLRVDVVAAVDDELFDPVPMLNGVAALVRSVVRARVVPGGHLTCLYAAGSSIGANLEEGVRGPDMSTEEE
jgi:acylglycerol lipase